MSEDKYKLEEITKKEPPYLGLRFVCRSESFLRTCDFMIHQNDMEELEKKTSSDGLALTELHQLERLYGVRKEPDEIFPGTLDQLDGINIGFEGIHNIATDFKVKIRPLYDVAKEVTDQVIESYDVKDLPDFITNCKIIMVNHLEKLHKEHQDTHNETHEEMRLIKKVCEILENS